MPGRSQGDSFIAKNRGKSSPNFTLERVQDNRLYSVRHRSFFGTNSGESSPDFLWQEPGRVFQVVSLETEQTNNSQLLSWQKNSPHSLCRTCREKPNTLAEGNAGKPWPRCPPVFIPRNALKTSWPRSILPSKHLLLLSWLLLVPFWSGLVLLPILFLVVYNCDGDNCANSSSRRFCQITIPTTSATSALQTACGP